MSDPNLFEVQPSLAGDEVSQFFARARQAVVPEATSDDGWAKVVARSRTRTLAHRNWYSYAAGAAAAVVALFGVWSWQQQPMSSSSVLAGQTVNTANSQVAGSGGGLQTAPVVSPAQSATDVPASFTTWSISNSGKGTLYNLGSASCGQLSCATLLRSSDDGKTWKSVHVFEDSNMSSANGSDIPQIQPERAISEVRFATPQVGYVFGGDLWLTTDRGATFTKMSHPGQTTLDVEIAQNEVEVLAADNCAQGTCAGPLHLSRMAAPSADVVTQTVTYELPTPISDASLVVKDGQVGVDLVAASNNKALTPLRLEGGGLKPLPAVQGCAGSALSQMTAASNETDVWWGLCNPRVAGSQVAYAVLRSDDAGLTWTVTGQVSMPRLGQPSLAAADSTHIVIATGGPRDPGGPSSGNSSGALQVSGDGGHSFASTTGATALPDTGFDWAATPGGNDFYAVPRTEAGYWVSHNLGKTWATVDPT